VTRNSSNKAGRQNIGRKRLNLKALALMAALIPLASSAATAEFVPSGPVSVAARSGAGGRNDVFGRARISAMEKRNSTTPATC
jgi:tripartite-type tricarboxylate transporter receptor subunit TctC